MKWILSLKKLKSKRDDNMRELREKEMEMLRATERTPEKARHAKANSEDEKSD